MDIYRITFAGHREILNHTRLEDTVEKIIRQMLSKKEYVEIYIGRNGDFDILVASAVKRAQKAIGHHNSCLTLVQPYRMKDDEYYEAFYDEVIHPIPEASHPKSAITARNQWMIDQADLLVAYVEGGRTGGALSSLQYAQKHGVKTVNLADEKSAEIM